jgi:DNA-binding MarR family transcriptional regulator
MPLPRRAGAVLGSATSGKTGHLGYLLKHAHAQLEASTTRAREPLGLGPRALGVLRVLASREPTSQQHVAQLLDVDRTTTVPLLDTLQSQGIISRRPQVEDRRRNLVELTATGREVFAKAQQAARTAEREFLAPVDARDADRLRETLHIIVTH